MLQLINSNLSEGIRKKSYCVLRIIIKYDKTEHLYFEATCSKCCSNVGEFYCSCGYTLRLVGYFFHSIFNRHRRRFWSKERLYINLRKRIHMLKLMLRPILKWYKLILCLTRISQSWVFIICHDHM